MRSTLTRCSWLIKGPMVSRMIEGLLAAASTTGGDGIALRLPDRRRIVVQPGFDRQTLVELLHVLETASIDLDPRLVDVAGVVTRRMGT